MVLYATLLRLFFDSVFCLLVFQLLEDFNGHIVDSAVIENYDTAVGTRFYVNTTVLTEIIIAATEIVAYGLNGCVQFVCYLVHRAVGKTVFEATELVESYSFGHTTVF